MNRKINVRVAIPTVGQLHKRAQTTVQNKIWPSKDIFFKIYLQEKRNAISKLEQEITLAKTRIAAHRKCMEVAYKVKERYEI